MAKRRTLFIFSSRKGEVVHTSEGELVCVKDTRDQPSLDSPCWTLATNEKTNEESNE